MTTRRPGMALLVPLVLVSAAASIRLWGLGAPAAPVWDEDFYIYDANAYLGGGYGIDVGTAPTVKIDAEGTWIHPPLGKWMIALLGVGPFGLHPFGWRVPSLLAGSIGVLLLYLLALQLWGSIWWAGLAGSLLALDGLHIVQSRIATLDIFVTTFLTAGFLFLTLDRNRGANVPFDRRRRLDHRIFGSSYRLWSGVMFGAAAASKWVALFGLVFATLLSLVWVVSGSDASRRSRAVGAGRVLAAFIILPSLVYLASYAAFFYQHGAAAQDFLTLQARMLEYHVAHTQVQPENAPPWTWPLLLHPIRYFAAEQGDKVRSIVALGNPVLWWGFLALLPAVVFRAIRRPNWQTAVVLGGFAAMYLPWLFVGRSQFIYYLLPALPFMCLGTVAGLRAFPDRLAYRVAIAFGSLAMLAAATFAPVWVGLWMDRSWVDHLQLLPDWAF